MRKYAATLAEKAARQRALRSTGEMTLEAQQDESEESEDDMEALPMGAIMPQVTCWPEWILDSFLSLCLHTRKLSSTMDAIVPQVNRQSRAAW